MKKRMWFGLILFVLLGSNGILWAAENEIFIGRLYISNTLEKITYDIISPGDSVETITNKDKVLFYHSRIVILNPTKKKYHIEVHCVDNKDRLVFKGVRDRALKYYDHLGDDVIAQIIQQLEMDPRSGAMIEEQKMPLENDSDYFFKLYVDQRLIGITRIHYLIKK